MFVFLNVLIVVFLPASKLQAYKLRVVVIKSAFYPQTDVSDNRSVHKHLAHNCVLKFIQYFLVWIYFIRYLYIASTYKHKKVYTPSVKRAFDR